MLAYPPLILLVDIPVDGVVISGGSDVDEAMLLANRIFVFGAGVGRVVYDLKFGEDKPPHEKMFEDPEMIELRNTLMRMLHSNIDL